jgi:hypothetical protein
MRQGLWTGENWDYIAQKEHCWKDLVTWATKKKGVSNARFIKNRLLGLMAERAEKTLY